MKLKYLFIALASSLFMFAACEKEEATSLDSIKLDKTYLSIPAGGGQATLTIDAKAAWSFANDISLGKDSESKTIYGQLPAWLTASTLSGGAGKTTVTFSAEAIDGGREQELHILVGDGDIRTTQYVIVRQGSLEAVKATCAEVLAGTDGKTFTTSGVCTSIANTNYGNWYLNDGTGEVYIYGTVDATGSYNWNSFGIEVGDVVTVQGPKTTYNGTVELVDVSVIKVVKSLLKLDIDSFVADKAGDELSVKAAYKGNGVLVNPADEWIVLKSMDSIKGVPTKIEPNPADTAIVKFRILPNEGAARKSSIVFTSSTSSVTVAVDQAGLDLTVSEVIAAEKGDMVTTKPSLVVAKTTKGFVISDGAKAVYVYDSGANANVKIGDNVVVKGSKTVYNGVPEVEKVSEVTVESSGNTVTYPNPKYVTDYAPDYKAAEAEYITICGKLAVSGNYLNVTLEGIDASSTMGSIVYPADDLNAKSFDGKNIQITGYFNGWSGSDKYLNVIATSIVEYTPGAKGTYTNPYTPSEIAPLLAGSKIEGCVFVSGKVSKIASQFSSNYGNAQFWISDDGAFKNDPVQDFEAYNVWYLGNRKWVDGDQTVKEGDAVLIYGEVTYYAKNKVAETNGKRAYLHTLNGVAK